MSKNDKSKVNVLPLSLYDEIAKFENTMFNEDRGWDTPEYIFQNMIHNFRYYQNEALRYYHYSQTSKEFRHRNINHVLFHMATGSGKTDLMAGLILYLFEEHNYQNFMFLVNTNGVLNKTIENLTMKTSNKYLYSQEIEISGNRIKIKKVDVFPKNQSENTIYLKLDTVQTVASDIYTVKEDAMGKKEFERNKVVILGDEAHHYSSSTKAQKELEKSWEKAISIILNAREDNQLLEFTATIPLEDKNIYAKYKDKILYRYALDRFIEDKFSKNVKRIQSSNTDEDNMLNTILLSEYRRLYAFEEYGIYMKPVIMFKSQGVAASNNAHGKFNSLVEKLTLSSFRTFLKRQEQVSSEKHSETLVIAHEYYRNNNDKLTEIIYNIKREFGSNRIINANDTSQTGILNKGQYEALNSLESPSNLYRVVFAVAKLTEGWDVLNLFDIVRISEFKGTKGTKQTTTSEAQLIGRGARYYPFILNNKKSYKRRFEDDNISSLILETVHYHTINEPQYLKNLINSLNEMNLPTSTDEKNPLLDVKVKKSFKQTDVWKYGNIYYNETIEVSDSYYDNLNKYGIDNENDITISWIYSSQEVGYKETIITSDYNNTHNIPIEVDERYFHKAMNRLRFYKFNNLKKYITQLKSKEDFLKEKWLNINNRTIYATVPNTMNKNDIEPYEKLEILEIFLSEISRKIKINYKKKRGTGKFIGYPIRDYVTDYRKRIPNYDTSRLNQSRAPQNVNAFKIEGDYFIYDLAIINQTEKQFVDRISERITELKEKYSDVYLIRMDENMHRESEKSDKLKLHQFADNPKEIRVEGFQPDFILYLQNEEFHIQIFVEPKGKSIEQDQWKENLLIYINENKAEVIFEDEVENVIIKGVKFYTMNDERDTLKQISQITLGEDFKGLSMKDV